MELETTLSKNIAIADKKAQYDAACKRLLSEKIILAWIMKTCVEEYRNCEVEEIAEKYIQGTPQVSEVPIAPDESNATSMIQGIGNEDVSMTEGTITYDIRFTAVAPVSEELIRLIINVEAQNKFYAGYPLIKRAIYYCSRMISSQYETEFTNSHYEKIKKVYSIWICMNPPKNRENTITTYSIQEQNIVGNVKEEKANYDLMTAVMVCLGNAEDGHQNEVLELLDILLSTKIEASKKKKILQEHFEIKMSQMLESEVTLMCNLSDGVLEEGLQRGLQQGLQQGEKKGILFSIQNLMKSMNLTAEQAMTALGVKESEYYEYYELLNKK